MKKVFIATTILVLCVLITSCGKPAPTAKSVPVPAPDTWSQQTHQAGEVQIAPGESFTVSLTPDTDLNRVWEESTEIINPSVVEKVDYKSESSPGVTPRQTWTFKGLAKGSCVILFKTSGRELELYEWTYSLFVGIKSSASVTASAVGTLKQTVYNISDVNANEDKGFYTHTEYDVFELHGTLEGKTEGAGKVELDFATGEAWMRVVQETFTGTVNGKSGTLELYKVSWGKLDPPKYLTGWGVIKGTIISGTGDLANLRGIINDDYTMTGDVMMPPSNYSYTLWWLD
jgi:hypothetical protein